MAKEMNKGKGPGQRKGQRQGQRRDRRDIPKEPVIWNPVTNLGKLVKEGKITDIEEIFDNGLSILEPQIVDHLLPGIEEELLLIGQAKGKFGGGQRRIFRQTQKKTREGNKISFTTCAVVGNRNGYIGISTGRSRETVPARDKAKSRARLNLIRIRRGNGSWESDSKEPNTIPFAVEGKCGSVKIKLMPAPRGKGLCVEKECAKILELAGIKDIWSQTRGQTKTKLNLISALIDALKKLSEMKFRPEDVARLSIVEGKLKSDDVEIVPPESRMEPTAEVPVEEAEPVAGEAPGPVVEAVEPVAEEKNENSDVELEA